MATTKATIKDLARQIQNKSARARIKILLDAIVDKVDAIVAAESGFMTADADGRAIIASDFFDAATVDAKFADDCFTAAVIAAKVDAKAIDTGSIADGAIEALQLASDAVTTAKILDANVTAAKLAAVLCSAPTTRSGPGAIAITAPTCLLTTTGVGDALTVADGTYAGQRLLIKCVGDGGTGVITQTTGAKLRAAVTSITFTSVGDWVQLEWSGTLWNDVCQSGVTIATS